MPTHFRPSSSGCSDRRWIAVLDGQRLRQLRQELGLSREELAAKAVVSGPTVARLERRPRAACRSRTLPRLAAAVGEAPAALGPAGDQLVGLIFPGVVLAVLM
ncbi:MAG: helix-turn-helix domain-containing protein [Streptosporangiales bacterium]